MNPANLAPLVAINQSIVEALNAANECQRLGHQCAQQSRLIAALVAQHGGTIRRSVWDKLDHQPGFANYTVRLDEDFAEVVMAQPVLTIANTLVFDQLLDEMREEETVANADSTHPPELTPLQ